MNDKASRVVAGAAVVLQQEGRVLPGEQTAEILAAAVAWGVAWRDMPAVPDGKQHQARRDAVDAAFRAVEDRLRAALRPAVPGL